MNKTLLKNEDNVYYAWISARLGVGSAAFKKLYELLGSGRKIYESTSYEKAKLTEKQLSKLLDKNLNDAKKSIDSAIYSGFIPVSYESEHYPEKLKKISNPPAILYCKGKLLDFDKYHCVGFVGTRKPSRQSAEYSKSLAAQLAKEGVFIISGIASGIDAEAHFGALSERGITAGISGVKAGQHYPTENSKLYNDLYRNGVVICEHSPADIVQKGAFPIRNRIISALSDALIMAEAPLKSGALITAEKCLSLRKPVFVPNAHFETNEGGRMLLENGGIPLNSKDDVLEFLNTLSHKEYWEIKEEDFFPFEFIPKKRPQTTVSKESENKYTSVYNTEIIPEEKSEEKTNYIPENKPESKEIISGLSKEENDVYNFILSNGSVSTDQIIKALKLSSMEVTASASMLEIYGYVRRIPGDKWSII